MADDALHELTAPYALDALDADEARAYERHLAHCEHCRGELASFSTAATAFAYAVPPSEPSAALRGRILVAARDERPNVVPLRPRFAPVRALAAVASVAAIALAVWGVVLQHRLDNAHGTLQAVTLRGASGSLVVGSGGQGTLVVAGLHAPAAGKTYEAWVIDHSKAMPAGTFGGGRTVVVHLRGKVPSGAVVGVTVEPAGGSQQPTTQPFITSVPV